MSRELQPVCLKFDTAIFSVETVKRALYRFGDRCAFDIRLEDPVIAVTVAGQERLDPSALDVLCGKIRNEVLDQSLRDSISQETANIRTLILANAFSNSGLIET